LWKDNPASKFEWQALAKFNCILAEARWYYEYRAWFSEEDKTEYDADADEHAPCDCLWKEKLDCFVGYVDAEAEDPELLSDEDGYDKIREFMEPFLASTNKDEDGPTTTGYDTATTQDEFAPRPLNAWRADYDDAGKILFPWDQAAGSYTQKALHFTYVFQIFVFMQIFNQINARKLKKEEINVFSGMCKNVWFNVIMVVTFLV